MKKELSKPMVVGIIAALVLIIGIIYYVSSSGGRGGQSVQDVIQRGAAGQGYGYTQTR